MYQSIYLMGDEKSIAASADASPYWRRSACHGDFWQRWEFLSDPPVGLYLGRGVGPTRSAEREKKVDTWPTPSGSPQMAVDVALDAAVRSLTGGVVVCRR